MVAISRCSKLLALAAGITGAAAGRAEVKEHSFAVGAEMPQSSLQGFEGKTAYEELCGFVADRELTKSYNKVGCVKDCASLTIDCKTDKDNTIHIKYDRHKRLNWKGHETTTYGIQKDHQSMNGKLFLFEEDNGQLGLDGCTSSLSKDASVWCEAPKWTEREDAKADEAKTWSMTYTWLFWDNSVGQWVLAEDHVEGTKEADVVLNGELRSQGLPEGVNPVGPHIQDGWYTVGVKGYTEACSDNDKHKGEDFPIAEAKVCEVDVYKMYPGAENQGKLVKAKWTTKHSTTDEKKRFESSR